MRADARKISSGKVRRPGRWHPDVRVPLRATPDEPGRRLLHRRADHDISLARLAGELAEEPLPFAVAPLADSPIGASLTVACTERCDQVEHFCPSGYLCEERAGEQICAAKEDEGGCAAGGGGGFAGWLAALGLLAAALSCPACSRALRRRRRRPGTA